MFVERLQRREQDSSSDKEKSNSGDQMKENRCSGTLEVRVLIFMRKSLNGNAGTWVLSVPLLSCSKDGRVRRLGLLRGASEQGL